MLISIIIILSSCGTLDEIDASSGQNMRSFQEMKNLNGDYNVNSVDRHFSLINIFSFDTAALGIVLDSASFVRIKVISEELVEASLYNGSSVVQTKLLKGKLGGDFFTLKPKLSVGPVYVLINFYGSSQSRFSYNYRGNLVVDHERSGCGLIVLFPFMCANREGYSLEFKRL